MSDLTQILEPINQKIVILFPEAVLILDSNGIILRVDNKSLTMFGRGNEDELIGKSCLEFIAEEDKHNVEEAIKKILDDGSIIGLQCNAVKKDGEFLRVTVNGSIISTSQGTKEIITVVHDITPHLSELEQAKEEKRQLAEAQQIAHFGSWEWDISSDTFKWTNEMYSLFTLTPHESTVNQETLIEHVHDEDKEKVKNFITHSLAEGSAVVDFRFVDPQNGSVHWFHSKSKTFYNINHEPLRMVGTVHDVTHEKELDQVKTQFLSVASHQMRGPLTTINWNAEMLLQSQAEGLTDMQKKYIQELYNASKRTVHLTNDILTVSELELGRMPFKPERLSLPKIAKRVLEDYDHKLADNKINFKEVYSGDLPEIQTDLFLLKTIFNELISNAINYTPQEGTITMTISTDPTRTNTFLISVADTGFGIPINEQEKIFSKMYRATNAKTKVMGGTGLGLYIVKLILQLNGGEIWFTSEENKGTTFNVSIPFVPKTEATVIIP